MELGADVVKVPYTGDKDSFAAVCEGCAAPVVIAGGPKTKTTREFLTMIRNSLDAGGKGLSVGRNIFQDRDPDGCFRPSTIWSMSTAAWTRPWPCSGTAPNRFLSHDGRPLIPTEEDARLWSVAFSVLPQGHQLQIADSPDAFADLGENAGDPLPEQFFGVGQHGLQVLFRDQKIGQGRGCGVGQGPVRGQNRHHVRLSEAQGMPHPARRGAHGQGEAARGDAQPEPHALHGPGQKSDNTLDR